MPLVRVWWQKYHVCSLVHTHTYLHKFIFYFLHLCTKIPPSSAAAEGNKMASVQRNGLWLRYLCVCVCACVLYVHCGWRGHYIYTDLYIEASAYFGIEILAQEMGRKRKCKSNIYKIYTPHPPTSTFPLYTLPALC